MYSGPGEQRDTRQITERHSDLVGNSAAGGKRAGKCELGSRTKARSVKIKPMTLDERCAPT
jgi:hypothetical protein